MAVSAAVNAHAATVAATPSPTVSPSVDPTPVVHAVAQQAAAHSSLIDSVNAFVSQIPQSELVAVAAVIVVALQSFLNRFPWLQHEVNYVQDLRRQFVAVVLPFLGVMLAGFASGQNTMHLAPVVYLVGQVVYYVVKTLQGAAANLSSASAETAPAEGQG